MGVRGGVKITVLKSSMSIILAVRARFNFFLEKSISEFLIWFLRSCGLRLDESLGVLALY